MSISVVVGRSVQRGTANVNPTGVQLASCNEKIVQFVKEAITKVWSHRDTEGCGGEGRLGDCGGGGEDDGLLHVVDGDDPWSLVFLPSAPLPGAGSFLHTLHRHLFPAELATLQAGNVLED